MRISDWSSDVCSSDLGERHHHPAFHYPAGVAGCGRSWRCWPAAGLIHAPALLTARLEWTDVTGAQLIPEWIACVFHCVCVLPVFPAMRVCPRAPVFQPERCTAPTVAVGTQARPKYANGLRPTRQT